MIQLKKYFARRGIDDVISHHLTGETILCTRNLINSTREQTAQSATGNLASRTNDHFTRLWINHIIPALLLHQKF
jgi:hypothetical protein